MDYNTYSTSPDNDGDHYSALLQDWLDGVLGSEHEETLFIALGNNAALRSEMQDLMRLRRAVQHDTAAFTPDPADTGAIFANLGFAVPADIPNIPPAVSATTSASAPASAAAPIAATPIAATQTASSAPLANTFLRTSAMKRFARGFGSALASAVLASVITILLLDWRSGNLFSNVQASNNGASTRFPANAGSADAGASNNYVATPPPFSPNAAYLQTGQPNGFYGIHDTSRTATRFQESFQSQSQRVIVREIVHEVVRYASPYDLFSNPGRYSGSSNTAPESASNQVLQEQTALLKEAIEELRSYKTASDKTTSAKEPPQSASPLVSMATMAASDSTTPPKTSSQVQSPQNEPQSGFQEILHKVRLGVRGMTSFSLPAPSLEPTAPALGFLNNVAVSLHYALTPHHAVGVEAGQEAYFQQYRTAENQDSYMVSQYPTQVWGGLSYKYTFLPEQAFTPFAGAAVGVAGYGVMGRTQIGCLYAPDGITQFVLGVEASSLFYGHQGTNYFSPKIGITYGATLHF